jgi:hypothetical protein
VVQIWSLAGRIDFLVSVACRDPHHLERVTVDGFAGREEVGKVETWLVFDSAWKGLPIGG